MRRQISSKSDTCTEGMDVDAAGISVKVGAHYPGRSVDLPCATGIERCGMGRQKSAEGIVGLLDRAEGPNMKYGQEP